MSDEEKMEPAGTIPVEWKAGTETTVGRSHAPIVRPNARQLKVFSNQRARTCGECRFFRHKAFQEIKERFTQELVNDYEWKLWNLGADPNTMGRCLQNTELVVGPNSLGCESFKVK